MLPQKKLLVPQMKHVGLLFQRKKMDTAGSCFEETCFTLPEQFLHLILVGRCEDG